MEILNLSDLFFLNFNISKNNLDVPFKYDTVYSIKDIKHKKFFMNHLDTNFSNMYYMKNKAMDIAVRKLTTIMQVALIRCKVLLGLVVFKIWVHTSTTMLQLQCYLMWLQDRYFWIFYRHHIEKLLDGE